MTGEVKAHLFEAFFTHETHGQGHRFGPGDLPDHRSSNPAAHRRLPARWAKARPSRFIFREWINLWTPPRRPTSRAASARDGNGCWSWKMTFRASSGCGCVGKRKATTCCARTTPGCVARGAGHKGAPISLAVTDVIMPVMGGKVMAEWLKTNVSRSQISVHVRVHGRRHDPPRHA